MTNERKTRDVEGILHFLTRQQMAEEIVRLDAALAQALRLPNDFRILPVEATDAMMDADWDVTMSDAHCNGGVSAAAWRAMAEAAPQVTYGNGHSGPGWYMHDNEYPEEGALFLSDTSADERAVLAAARPLPQATLSETLSDEKIKSLAIQHGAFNAGDSRGLILWEHAGFNAGGLFGFARAVLAAARQVAPLPESMSRDEILKYYSDYANMVANEVIGYQKQIRDLKAALAASPSPVGQEEPGHKCGEGVGIVGVKGLDRG